MAASDRPSQASGDAPRAQGNPGPPGQPSPPPEPGGKGRGWVDAALGFVESKVDPWRDTPLRLLGYANEVGEGFRPLLPRLVGPSYAISVGYVLVDTHHKWQRARAAEPKGNTISPGAAAADTLIWQLFASVIVPGFLINRVVYFTRIFARSLPRSPLTRALPTVVGLAVIPGIVHPVDTVVHRQMDSWVRPHLGVPAHYEEGLDMHARHPAAGDGPLAGGVEVLDEHGRPRGATAPLPMPGEGPGGAGADWWKSPGPGGDGPSRRV